MMRIENENIELVVMDKETGKDPEGLVFAYMNEEGVGIIHNGNTGAQMIATAELCQSTAVMVKDAYGENDALTFVMSVLFGLNSKLGSKLMHRAFSMFDNPIEAFELILDLCEAHGEAEEGSAE